ncbi:hypothetical protein CHLNCDRAFT_135578 [Chlorella variabilis]|uniref:Uncharacterized protein n=1 Tax=Chlorella variabilis TaxID=554065 RepID=E1ZIH9_CHLVA|nr:hypothetical protein CHLNCDRAFT_135578 [Chlorella variabilis]EFN54162.1 hypothetical protein CHLNCDRAFT_135578 [Chlorella variabilis]|eukprot:XP_005846264.1 hypothetical protein CHLNCDRAFT_135578 [Chlorella variabilis]
MPYIKVLSWSKASKGSMLSVKRGEGPPISFMGFRDKDVEALRTITNRQIKDEPLAASGHNWGRLAVDGGSMVFRVGGRPAFSVPLPEVSQAQQVRDEVMLEFPMDDTLVPRLQARGASTMRATRACLLLLAALALATEAGVRAQDS